MAEEPRHRAALGGARRTRAGTRRAGDAVRLPPLPRLRRLRRSAPTASAHPRGGAASRRRPARARQRRQAVARRHPRDRIHRAVAAGGAWWAVSRDPHALDAARPAAAGGSRLDGGGHREPPVRCLYAVAPHRAPHPIPGRPADPRAAHRRRRPDLDRALDGRHLGRGRLPSAGPTGLGARVRGQRVRRAAARRPGTGAAEPLRSRLQIVRPGRIADRRAGPAGHPATGTGPARDHLVGASAGAGASRRDQASAGAAGAACRGLRGRPLVHRGSRASFRRLAGAAAAARVVRGTARRATRGAEALVAAARPGALADAVFDAPPRRHRRTGRPAPAARALQSRRTDHRSRRASRGVAAQRSGRRERVARHAAPRTPRRGLSHVGARRRGPNHRRAGGRRPVGAWPMR